MQISGVGKGLNVYDAYKYMYQWYWYGLVSIRSILYVRNTESSTRQTPLRLALSARSCLPDATQHTTRTPLESRCPPTQNPEP